MTAKENARRIIAFDRPERVVSGPPCFALQYFGCDHEGWHGSESACPVGSKWVDVWGTEWHKEHADVMGFPKRPPIPSPDAMRSYRWPDPDDERICSRIYALAEEFKARTDRDDLFLNGRHRDTLWEKTYMLVGMENAMVHFFSEPGFMRDVLHRIMDFQLGIAAHYARVGVEMVSLGDDLGTQRGPLLGPDLVHEFFVPEYRRLFDFYKSRGVLVNFHSCGCIERFLEMFMDLGVDVLNPVQATANDLGRIRAETHGRMTLQGAVSTALVMEGPPERIAHEVRRRMWQLGRDGGYFCAPDQGMPFPKEHIDALHRAIDQYGRYPLLEPERAAADPG